MTTRRRALLTAAAAAPLAGCAGTAPPATGEGRGSAGAGAGADRREVRADGWAALEGGTPLAQDVRPEHELAVHNRAELDAALALGDTPKLLRVHGRIDLASGRGALTGTPGRSAFADPAWDFDAYCRAYAPAVWGRRAPAGPLEDARRRSARRQADAVVVKIPPRTTLVGATPDAGFADGALLLDGSHHVVLRGLAFHGVQDHFPQWDPLDGADGEWNSDHDAVALRRSHHVWVDRCGFRSAHPARETALGRPVQRNDGLLDITRASDLVTVSWCRFADHDKTMLIGGGDGHAEDEGRLRVSLHHNLWERCAERTPRVRYGRVHIANNLYVAPDAARYGYSIGLGHRARIVSEANAWQTDAAIPASRLVRVLAPPGTGARFADRGSHHNGRALDLAALLRQADPALAPDDAPAFAVPPVRGLVAAHELGALLSRAAGPPAMGQNRN